jgi:ring-1,2-phenylacetyl-CoA epoxidase subunit PaaB
MQAVFTRPTISSSQIVASDPAETASFFEPAEDKIYRHPTFYDMPDGVENL